MLGSEPVDLINVLASPPPPPWAIPRSQPVCLHHDACACHTLRCVLHQSPPSVRAAAWHRVAMGSLPSATGTRPWLRHGTRALKLRGHELAPLSSCATAIHPPLLPFVHRRATCWAKPEPRGPTGPRSWEKHANHPHESGTTAGQMRSRNAGAQSRWSLGSQLLHRMLGRVVTWVNRNESIFKSIARGQKGRFPARLATSICQLRYDPMEQGPTEPHAGRSTFLLSSGGVGGGYY